MPKYPVQKFADDEEFESRVFHADPWIDKLPTVEEIEQKYGKKKVENQQEDDQIVEKMDTNELTTTKALFEENSKELVNAW